MIRQHSADISLTWILAPAVMVRGIADPSAFLADATFSTLSWERGLQYSEEHLERWVEVAAALACLKPPSASGWS